MAGAANLPRTRASLLELRRSLQEARDGHALLERKREVLLREVWDLMRAVGQHEGHVREAYDAVRGPMRFRRMNIKAVESDGEEAIDSKVIDYAGHRMYYMWPEYVGQQFLHNGTVWVRHHTNSGWDGGFRKDAYRDSKGQLVEDPVTGKSTFLDNLYPYDAMLDVDTLGTYASWPETVTVRTAVLMRADLMALTLTEGSSKGFSWRNIAAAPASCA